MGTWTFEDIEHVYPWSKWLTATDQEQFLDEINAYVGEHHDYTPEWHELILAWGKTAQLWHDRPGAMQALVRQAPSRYTTDAEGARRTAVEQYIQYIRDDLAADVEARSLMPRSLMLGSARTVEPKPERRRVLRDPGSPPQWTACEWAAYFTMLAAGGLCGVLGRNMPLWWVPVAIVVAVVAGLSVLSVCSFVTAFRCSYKARLAEEERS